VSFYVIGELNKDFQQKKIDSPVVGDFAEVFINRVNYTSLFLVFV